MAESNSYLINYDEVEHYRKLLERVPINALIQGHANFLAEVRLMRETSRWLCNLNKEPLSWESQIVDLVKRKEKECGPGESAIALAKREVNDSWEDAMNRVRVIEETLRGRGMTLVKL